MNMLRMFALAMLVLVLSCSSQSEQIKPEAMQKKAGCAGLDRLARR